MTTFRTTVHSMAMPFVVEIDDADAEACEPAVAQFHAALEWADDVFSRWREDSYLRMLERGELTLDEAPRELREVLEACEWFREVTAGGFDARRADGVVDPTGLVKGWAVARAARHLDGARGTGWMVGASGDVLVAPGTDRRIGIADPRVKGDPTGTAVIDVVALGGAFTALATSGGAQVVDHIWDPATGEVARHYQQVSVAGTDLTEADAWATAIAGGGPRIVAAALDRGLEVMVVTGERYDGTFDAQTSPGWPSVR
ncbi:FAD:protein FMN transferase [Demequina sp. SYSU T00039]|uniref:FAD:protein FMN transferase n=1 Tax=Demequina lignilytica TaxID=3051663 RepID=A0AAW7M8W3_9MICO|nr:MULTISPECIES: FAD:protein FMN transferase [unclassified Demequina]MDN4477213.1 FAD:protein FMN transferase [Demequina sp. SYSU T00039-1]MDN4487386.1 FAD:protein FMN transferase [Demequina sp. SYSU T00039]